MAMEKPLEPVLKVGETIIFCHFRDKINRF